MRCGAGSPRTLGSLAWRPTGLKRNGPSRYTRNRARHDVEGRVPRRAGASVSAAIASPIEDDGLDVSCGLVVVNAEEEADPLTHDRCPGAAPRATGPCARGRAGATLPASPSDGGPRCSPGLR